MKTLIFFLIVTLIFNSTLVRSLRNCLQYNNLCICDTDQYTSEDIQALKQCNYIKIKETKSESLDHTLNVTKSYNRFNSYNAEISSIEISRGKTKNLTFNNNLRHGFNVMIIENTFISTLDSNNLKSLPNLILLDLTNNKISTMVGSPFKFLNVLRILKLVSNNIVEIEEDTFYGLSNLNELYLNNNKIQILDNELNFNSKAVTHNSLKILDLSDNNILHIKGAPFKYLTGLNKLYLRNTNISTINKYTFDGLNNLKILDMHGSLLRTIEINSFPQSLQTLHLITYNVNVISKKLTNLHQLEEFYFETSNRENDILEENMFEGLIKLPKLNLTNRIATIQPHAFKGLSLVKEIRLENNCLENLNRNSFSYLPSLKIINLQNNKLKCTAESQNNRSLNPVDEDKTCDNIFNAFIGLDSIEIILLSGNKIEKLKENSFSMLPHLKFLDLSNISISFIEHNALGFLNNLQILNMSNNFIKTLPVSFLKNTPSLQELNLSSNQISTLTYGTFSGLKMLTYLDLSYNYISNLNEEIFFPLENLYNLNIAFNQISRLNVTAFKKYLPRIRLIHLYSNRIDCSQLTNIMEAAKIHNIELVNMNPMFNDTNVNGFLCNHEESPHSSIVSLPEKYQDVLDYLRKNFNLTLVTQYN